MSSKSRFILMVSFKFWADLHGFLQIWAFHPSFVQNLGFFSQFYWKSRLLFTVFFIFWSYFHVFLILGFSSWLCSNPGLIFLILFKIQASHPSFVQNPGLFSQFCSKSGFTFPISFKIHISPGCPLFPNHHIDEGENYLQNKRIPCTPCT